MHALAVLIMRGPGWAALVAATSVTLALLVPPLLFVSGAVLALVTLRQGLRQGALVTLAAAAGAGVFALLSLGSLMPVVWLALVFWLPLLLLAEVLRQTISLATVLRLIALLGLAAVVAFYLFIGDPETWFKDVVQKTLQQLLAAGMIEPSMSTQFGEVLTSWAPLLPSQLASSLVISLILALLLARWWQARLYNPGGFRQEFHNLRLGRTLALVMLVLLGLAMAVGAQAPIFVNLAMVMGVFYMLQGIALVHGVVAKLACRGLG